MLPLLCVAGINLLTALNKTRVNCVGFVSVRTGLEADIDPLRMAMRQGVRSEPETVQILESHLSVP